LQHIAGSLFRLGFFQNLGDPVHPIEVAVASYKEVSAEFEKASLDFSSVGIAIAVCI
jgi:hypothetical protein